MNQKFKIEIRELTKIEEFRRGLELQREAFHLPDLEISPLRHFVVTTNCGGFVLGAFTGDNLIGFVHHLIAVQNKQIIGYSHMTAIATDFQNAGIGAQLKWAQREKALALEQNFIKWTFDPMQSRNAHFNLNRLGAVVRSYAENYYGSDYILLPDQWSEKTGLDSDRLFAEWQLDSERVACLAQGKPLLSLSQPVRTIEIPGNWRDFVQTNPEQARKEQLRVRSEFQAAFADDLICAGFERGATKSKYLLYKQDKSH